LFRSKEVTVQDAIELRIDLEVGAAYVRYRPRGVHGTSVRLSEDVVVHYDPENHVAGIELIEVVPQAIRAAEAFPSQNGLGFPSLEPYMRDHEGARSVG
jgi:uncharacterized protein YuzE